MQQPVKHTTRASNTVKNAPKKTNRHPYPSTGNTAKIHTKATTQAGCPPSPGIHTMLLKTFGIKSGRVRETRSDIISQFGYFEVFALRS